MKFELIEHTADTGLIAYGDDMKEAFANAAYGLFSIITDLRKVRTTEKRIVHAAADNMDGLLVEWLNTLIYLFDVDMMLFKKFEIKDLHEKELEAVCYGEKCDPVRHDLRMGVKSATYYMLEVDREKHRVQVIFDV